LALRIGRQHRPAGVEQHRGHVVEVLPRLAIDHDLTRSIGREVEARDHRDSAISSCSFSPATSPSTRRFRSRDSRR
jgi:hypothetical protein